MPAALHREEQRDLRIAGRGTRRELRNGLDAPADGEHGPWHSETMIRVPVAYVIGSVAAFWTV
jgi:hypothetical protein